MSKITLNSVADITQSSTAQTTINTNSSTVQTAFDNTLSRDGTSPNQMGAALDMNSNQIINLPAPSTQNSPARLIDVVSNPTIVVPGTGTSGHTVPFLDGNNTFSGNNTFAGNSTFSGTSTLGATTVTTLNGSAVPVTGTSAHTIPFLDGTNTWSGVNTFSNAVNSPNGLVTMSFISGAWKVSLPNGTFLNTSGTTTSGLQEAINYSTTNGYNLLVNGGSVGTLTQTGTLTSGSNIITGLSNTALLTNGWFITGPGIPFFSTITSIDSPTQIHINNNATASGAKSLKFAFSGAVLNCSTTVNVPAVQQWSFQMVGTNLNFIPGTTGNGLVFDSFMDCDISLSGQVVFPGQAGAFAILFAPVNPVPVDGFITIIDSRIFLGNVTCNSLCSAIGVNCSLGAVNHNLIEAVEINSGVNSFNIFAPSVTTGFSGNVINIVDAHGVSNVGVIIGSNTTNAAQLANNIWNIGTISTSGTGSGFATYGSKDIISIGSIRAETGTLNQGVVFNSSCVGNILNIGLITGNSGAAFTDAGTSNLIVCPVSGIAYGAPTGGLKGTGTINVSSGIYLNNVAYTSP